MKVRIGVGTVPQSGETDLRAALTELVDTSEELGIDSVWFSDLISAPVAVDPLVAMGWATARTTHLKAGTGVTILPGRNPAVVASQLASLAALSPKRILPVFGSRPVRGPDRPAYTAAGPAGTDVFEEALGVVRALLSSPSVTHHGQHFHLDDVRVAPQPPRPLDIWLGGRVPAALERVGRLGDGWLGSFLAPIETESARRAIEKAASEAGRTVEDDHFGTNVVVAYTEEAFDRAVAAAATQRKDLDDPSVLVARGWDQARDQVRQHVEGGITKFVVRPAGSVPSRRMWLEAFVQELVPLQT